MQMWREQSFLYFLKKSRLPTCAAGSSASGVPFFWTNPGFSGFVSLPVSL